jgi:hypothetical protein
VRLGRKRTQLERVVVEDRLRACESEFTIDNRSTSLIRLISAQRRTSSTALLASVIDLGRVSIAQDEPITP